MATWHQQRNASGLRALWAPPVEGFKVVVDRLHEMAFSVHFNCECDAVAYAAKTNGIVLRPQAVKVEG